MVAATRLYTVLMSPSGNEKRDELLEILDRDNAGRRVYDRLNAVELAQAIGNQRLDDHDGVLVDIRDHLKTLTASVVAWDKKFYVFVAVIAAGSPTGQDLIGKFLG